MTQVNESEYFVITLGELALINYFIDNATVGYKDVHVVAEIIESIPRTINANQYRELVKYITNEGQVSWIKRELAKNLELSNIPARFAVQCILLAQNTTVKDQPEQETQEDTGEEKDNEQ